MIGGHYTYAEVPLFDQIKEWFGSDRNNYDKVGHFVQGFVPAMIAREVLIRKKVVNGKGWLVLFIISICLAFSAFYELIEWWVAIGSGEDAEAFLGTQGYVWDTQSDMGIALFGAICAIVSLSKFHDQQLRMIEPPTETTNEDRWEIEYENQIIGELNKPEFEDQFWVSYELKVTNDDHKSILLDYDNWLADKFKFKSPTLDEYAELAIASQSPNQFYSANRVMMRSLYVGFKYEADQNTY